MYYVYILDSMIKPGKVYIGYTNSIHKRLEVHNGGKSAYTAKYKPWKLLGHMTFQEKSKAIAFEKYLKSGSGKAFISKHLL